jgi:hypothetical protein
MQNIFFAGGIEKALQKERDQNKIYAIKLTWDYLKEMGKKTCSNVFFWMLVRDTGYWIL